MRSAKFLDDYSDCDGLRPPRGDPPKMESLGVPFKTRAKASLFQGTPLKPQREHHFSQFWQNSLMIIVIAMALGANSL